DCGCVWGERRARFRFVAGNARLPGADGIGRIRYVEGSRTCVRSYPQTADHALDMPQTDLSLGGRSPRCGRKANEALTPYPANLRPLASQPASVVGRAGG